MWRPPNWSVVAALVFVCCAIYLLRRRTLAASALALGALFAEGALTMQVRGSYSEAPLRLGNGEEVVVIAHVIAEAIYSRTHQDHGIRELMLRLKRLKPSRRVGRHATESG